MENDNTAGIHISDIPLSIIVHLGAGRCSELEGYLALDPDRLILVEADPGLTAGLKDRVAGKEGIEVIEQAISGLPGKGLFRRYNQPDLSSLHAPTSALQELFPGLRMLEEIEIEAIAPETLLETLAIKEEGNKRLVIDLPGEELSVLDSLQKADYLHLFEEILFYCGREPFYEEGCSASDVLNMLQDQGYDIIAEDVSQDPDRPNWCLKRNRFHVQVRLLQEQVGDLVADRDALRVQLGEQDQVVERLNKESDEGVKRTAALEKKLAQAEESLGELERTASEYKVQVERLGSELDEQAKLARESEAEIQRMRQENTSLIEDLGESKDRLENAERAKFTQEEAIAGHVAEIEGLKAKVNKIALLEDQAEALRRDLAGKDEELVRKQQDLSVLVRLQSVKEMDFKEIQSRYAELLEIKERQDILLQKLTERLGAAAKYLEKLDAAGSNEVKDHDNQVGEVLEALTGQTD